MKNEREISLRFTIYEMLKHWRKTVIIAFVLALLFGAYKTYVLLNTYNNETVMEKERNQYQIKLDNFNEKENSLSTEMSNLKKAKQIQDEYNKNSILMKINPLKEYVCSFSVNIDSHYKINPELTYQNVDYTDHLLDAYKNYLTQGELYSEIIDKSSQIGELRYLTEIITVDNAESSALINIRIINIDEASCSEISELVINGVNKKAQELQKLIGEHSCTIVNESSYENVDLELDAKQQANTQYLAELSKNLSDKVEEYNEWVAAGEPVFQYSMTNIIRSIIKYALIAGLAGILLSLFYYFLIAIITNRVLSEKDLKQRTGITVIGAIPKKKIRKTYYIDKLIARIGEISLESSKYDIICKYIGCNIQGILNENVGSKIAVTSTLNKAKLESVIGEIQKGSSLYKLELVGNVLTDPSSVDLVRKADNVILVVEQGKATYTQIQNEIEHITLWNKSIIGAIMIEADAL